MPYDRTKPYNQLPLLPPPDEIIITPDILQAMSNANRALAELKGLARKLPNQSMLVNTIALREAKASTEIENIFTTDDDLYKALSGNESGLTANAKEVLRYRQALWAGFNTINAEKVVSKDLLIAIYQQIKELNDGFRPPFAEVVIRRRGSDLPGGTVVYTPPRGEDVLDEKLDNLIEYMNNDERYPYDPLIKLAVAHYQFEAIHPFRDGNGRTGRILNILFLVLKNLLEIPVLYLSSYIIENKDDYYALLNNVTTRDKWNEWLFYMFRCVEKTSLFTISRVNEIDELFSRTHALVSKKLPHIRKEVIERIFEQPYVSPRALLSRDIKSLNTAKKYLSQLASLGIMTPKKVGKEIIYINLDLFTLLSET
jgi:Fic family protein